MLEAAVLIDSEGNVFYEHQPAGRSSAYLPDSPDLWDKIWEYRESLWGVAHSHPGSGVPFPSMEDLTTFSAVELALGRRLEWPIVNADSQVVVSWKGPGTYDYSVEPYPRGALFATRLRRLSGL